MPRATKGDIRKAFDYAYARAVERKEMEALPQELKDSFFKLRTLGVIPAAATFSEGLYVLGKSKLISADQKAKYRMVDKTIEDCLMLGALLHTETGLPKWLEKRIGAAGANARGGNWFDPKIQQELSGLRTQAEAHVALKRRFSVSTDPREREVLKKALDAFQKPPQESKKRKPKPKPKPRKKKPTAKKRPQRRRR